MYYIIIMQCFIPPVAYIVLSLAFLLFHVDIDAFKYMHAAHDTYSYQAKSIKGMRLYVLIWYKISIIIGWNSWKKHICSYMRTFQKWK